MPAGLVQLLVRPVLQHLTQVVAADQPRMNAERRPVTILINHAVIPTLQTGVPFTQRVMVTAVRMELSNHVIRNAVALAAVEAVAEAQVAILLQVLLQLGQADGVFWIAAIPEEIITFQERVGNSRIGVIGRRMTTSALTDALQLFVMASLITVTVAAANLFLLRVCKKEAKSLLFKILQRTRILQYLSASAAAYGHV